MTNAERAHRASTALIAYAGKDSFDPADHLPDLMCDLLHYAKENGLETDSVLRSALSNFVAECLGPDNSFGPQVETTVRFI